MASYDLNRINTSLLKQHKASFDSESNNYTSITYQTFISSYLNNCSDMYISNIAQKLKYHYDKLNIGYKNISGWWTNYNDGIEELEKKLITDCLNNSDNLGYDNLNYHTVSINGMTFIYDLNGNIIKGFDASGNPISIFGEYNYGGYQYGGDQNVFSLDNELELLFGDKMFSIINKYYPNVSNNDYDALLNIYHNNIGGAGCGYVAITNCIFKAFEGKEKEFLDRFGYPMYNVDENGNIDFNYEYMTVDYFLYTCKNTFGVDFNGITSGVHTLSEKGNEFIKMTSPKGIIGLKSIVLSYFDDYLKQYGLTGSIKKQLYFDIDSTDKYKALIADGTQFITNSFAWRIDGLTSYNKYYPKGIFPRNGNFFVPDNLIVTNPFTEGHAMYITGVDNDGVHVSTWGGSAKVGWAPIGLVSSEFVGVKINVD